MFTLVNYSSVPDNGAYVGNCYTESHFSINNWALFKMLHYDNLPANNNCSKEPSNMSGHRILDLLLTNVNSADLLENGSPYMQFLNLCLFIVRNDNSNAIEHAATDWYYEY